MGPSSAVGIQDALSDFFFGRGGGIALVSDDNVSGLILFRAARKAGSKGVRSDLALLVAVLSLCLPQLLFTSIVVIPALVL
jgi:hypothetical protein